MACSSVDRIGHWSNITSAAEQPGQEGDESRWLGDTDLCLYRHSWRDPVQHLWRGVEDDLHGHPLNDLHEISRGVFRRQQRELGAGPGLDAVNVSSQPRAGEGIYVDNGRLTR